MATLAEKLQLTLNCKNDIKKVMNEKFGLNVTDDTPLSKYATKLENAKVGGSGNKFRATIIVPGCVNATTVNPYESGFRGGFTYVEWVYPAAISLLDPTDSLSRATSYVVNSANSEGNFKIEVYADTTTKNTDENNDFIQLGAEEDLDFVPLQGADYTLTVAFAEDNSESKSQAQYTLYNLSNTNEVVIKKPAFFASKPFLKTEDEMREWLNAYDYGTVLSYLNNSGTPIYWLKFVISETTEEPTQPDGKSPIQSLA